jgi:hypothetical protein
MKWFLVALMMTTYSDGGRDTYLFSEPAFSSLEECQIFTQFNSAIIRMELDHVYPDTGLDSIWCVREDKLKILFEKPGKDA